MKRSISLLLAVFLVIDHLAFAQGQGPQFVRLSTNEGLSQSHVNAILKDSKGFMWFATDEGLNKFDGYTFSVYKHYGGTPTSLGNNFVADILEDKLGAIWVATREGLDKFDRTSDTFSHYQRTLNVHDLFIDSHERMWLGTTTGLCRFNTTTGSVTTFTHKPADKHSLSDNVIQRIVDDDKGNLWVGTQNGLNRFNPTTNLADPYWHDPKKPESLSANLIRTLFRDDHNQIWVGTTGGGVSRYNAATDSFDTFRHDESDPASIGYNDVLSLMQDTKGDIWIGTENGGISIYHRDSQRFTTFVNDVHNDKSLSNNSVYCLYKDDVGNIWVGTYSGGINFKPVFGNKFTLYQHSPDYNSPSNSIILSIRGDAKGNIWLGTDGGGLNEFDPRSKRFVAYPHQPGKPNSPASDYIISLLSLDNNTLALGYHRNGIDFFASGSKTVTHGLPVTGDQSDLPGLSIIALFADSKRNLWISAWTRGLYAYNPQTKQLRKFVHNANNPNSLCDDVVNVIFEDESGSIWLGTENGLDCYDPNQDVFRHFVNDPRSARSLSNNTVNCLLSAGPNKLWVGTASGLCLFNKTTRDFTVLSERDGLPNNVISSLVRDNRGRIWMSTNRGICQYDPLSKRIRKYDITDGLQGNEFKARSVYQAPDGMLYFGGINGFNAFHPDSIRDNTYIPPVYLTDFQIFNKSVRAGEAGSPLSKPISVTRQITLDHNQGVFSFEFAALNYTLPLKNQYAYQLVGFDKDWNYVGNKRTATYTNLDPGDYVFRVKASNNDGVWNQIPTAVAVHILPPFWLTWWFRLLLLGLVAGLLYLFYRGRINRVQAQKWVLEQILAERTERLHQEQVLNKMKSQFVSTASHEFRTPLATIQSSIDLVDMYLGYPPDNSKPLIQKHLRIVEKEIGKFGNLLDDVLTIEKMNAGKVKFAPAPVDFLAITTDVIATHFQIRKDQRCVETSVSGTPRPVLLDEKLIRHALLNLLSNAFKFSTTNPRLTILFTDTQLTVSVSDTGIGIPDKDVPHLFETFFRAENVSTIQGTGLGLFITKQAIEQHGGSIQVNSQENAGTIFTISLPA